MDRLYQLFWVDQKKLKLITRRFVEELEEGACAPLSVALVV
jgi:hypothetical protein